MKNILLINFFAILFFAFFYQPTFVFGDTIYFDFDGNVIAKAQYEIIASDREKTLSINDSLPIKIESISLLNDTFRFQYTKIQAHF